LVANATVVTVYQTNPHIDAYAQARHCAELVLQTVRGRIRPTCALAMPPLVVNILCQGTDDAPMRDLVKLAQAQGPRPGVLSVSVVEGYPYADVQEMGMSFIAVTDHDAALAQDVVQTLALAAWQMRAELNHGAASIDAALLQAQAAVAGPVVLFDVGDNVGGGSPGDSTLITSAPMSASICVAHGPMPTPVMSTTRTPSSAPAGCCCVMRSLHLDVVFLDQACELGLFVGDETRQFLRRAGGDFRTLLAEAFVRLVQSGVAGVERLRLAIIGEGELDPAIRSVLAEAGLDGMAWMPGSRNDVAALLRAFDCFVLPSLAEGTSCTLQEAMASALPRFMRMAGSPGRPARARR
jgi:hypothetical protein